MQRCAAKILTVSCGVFHSSTILSHHPCPTYHEDLKDYYGQEIFLFLKIL
jgi:hypothetical protein